MVTKSDVENALKRAGIEMEEPASMGTGGWIFMIADMTSAPRAGQIETTIAALQAAEELERLCRKASAQ